MAQTQHTPGPWHVEGSYVFPEGAFSNPVGSVSRYLGQRSEQVAANARLIASAPDMLAALRWVRANYASGSTKEINTRIDAAIAKAEGSTNA